MQLPIWREELTLTSAATIGIGSFWNKPLFCRVHWPCTSQVFIQIRHIEIKWRVSDYWSVQPKHIYWRQTNTQKHTHVPPVTVRGAWQCAGRVPDRLCYKLCCHQVSCSTVITDTGRMTGLWTPDVLLWGISFRDWVKSLLLRTKRSCGSCSC